jgi:hypothetical protein
MFRKLKDWRHIATSYDKSQTVILERENYAKRYAMWSCITKQEMAIV